MPDRPMSASARDQARLCRRERLRQEAEAAFARLREELWSGGISLEPVRVGGVSLSELLGPEPFAEMLKYLAQVP